MNSEMPLSRSVSGGSPVSVNFLHLIEQYGRRVGLRSVADQAHLIAGLLDNMASPKISGQALKLILDGRAARNPQDDTLEALRSVFHTVLPGLKGTWLTMDDAAAFRALVAGTQPNFARLKVPDLQKSSDELTSWLCGTFIVYRFSFNQGIEEEVAREVLHVTHENHALNFRMSFLAKGNDPVQPTLFYTGVVLPVGKTVVYVGFSEDQTKPDRGRTLILHREDAPTMLRDFNLGLLTSTRMHFDSHPAVVCTLLIRMQWEPADLDAFIRQATRIASFPEIVNADFGSRHAVQIKKYLDNRPHNKEAVLRIDTNRFNRDMQIIFPELKTNTEIRSPFKGNWP